jgi:hypothetical protein
VGNCSSLTEKEEKKRRRRRKVNNREFTESIVDFWSCCDVEL